MGAVDLVPARSRCRGELDDRQQLSAGLHGVAAAQILGNQKIYGLWGLYTIPARASGLLEGEPTHLTVEVREVVERSLLPVLESAAPRAVSPPKDRE